MRKQSPRLPLWKAILWIVLSVLVCSGISHKLIKFYLGKGVKKEETSNRFISYIVQTGLQKQALHSDYLAELLDLAQDKVTLFSDFDEETAEKKLLISPLFQEAKVKKIPPNMIYVDYTVRKPIGWAADFVNTAFDKDKFLFPMAPFFSPKKLPEIYLGADGVKEAFLAQEPQFQIPLQGRYMDLALEVLEYLKVFEKEVFWIKKIDVSQAFAPLLGKRGIVLLIENEIEQGQNSLHYLRLTTDQFGKEIANYFELRSHLVRVEREKAALGEKIKEKIIDLRVPQLAFVD